MRSSVFLENTHTHTHNGNNTEQKCSKIGTKPKPKVGIGREALGQLPKIAREQRMQSKIGN